MTPGSKKTPKTQLRALLARHDALAHAYADAVVRGRRGWARARQRRIQTLSRRIVALARRHRLEAWVQRQLEKD